MRCEYQYFRIFDFGGFLDIEKARRLLEGSFLVKGLSPVKGAPEYISFAPVLSIEFGEQGLFQFENGTPCKVRAKIFEIGAISILFEAQMDCESVNLLRDHWGFALKQKGKTFRKSEIALALFDQIKQKLQSSLIDRYEIDVPPEYYTIFTLEPDGTHAVEFIEKNRRQLAALLINEKSPERLGDREVEEILGARYSYYHDEVSIVDWEATVTVCPNIRDEDDILAVLEVANLQLLELRTFDDYLDQVIEKASGDLRTIFSPGGFFQGRARRMVADLAETRVELEKMVDEISNVAKFYGDWYIARVYLGCRKKLHIERWLGSVQEKLNSLRDLYELAATESTNRRLLLLEGLIVILFVLDIVLIAVSGKL